MNGFWRKFWTQTKKPIQPKQTIPILTNQSNSTKSVQPPEYNSSHVKIADIIWHIFPLVTYWS